MLEAQRRRGLGANWVHGTDPEEGAIKRARPYVRRFTPLPRSRFATSYRTPLYPSCFCTLLWKSLNGFTASAFENGQREREVWKPAGTRFSYENSRAPVWPENAINSVRPVILLSRPAPAVYIPTTSIRFPRKVAPFFHYCTEKIIRHVVLS